MGTLDDLAAAAAEAQERSTYRPHNRPAPPAARPARNPFHLYSAIAGAFIQAVGLGGIAFGMLVWLNTLLVLAENRVDYARQLDADAAAGVIGISFGILMGSAIIAGSCIVFGIGVIVSLLRHIAIRSVQNG